MLRELEALDKNSRGFRYIVDAVDLVIEHAMSGEGLFVTKTVHELLWGYKDNLLSDIKGIQDEVNKRFKTHYQFVTSDWFGLGVSRYIPLCVCVYLLPTVATELCRGSQ